MQTSFSPAGGEPFGDIVSSGGTERRADAGSTVTPLAIAARAAREVSPGFITSTHISHYIVSAGQTSSNITLVVADTLTVLSGGVASAITVENDAAEYVSSGGSALADVVSTGGVVSVYAGGVTLDDVVSSGGVEWLSSGAVAVTATIESGGEADGLGELAGGSVYGTLSAVTLAGYLSSGNGVNTLYALGVESGADLTDDTMSSGVMIGGGDVYQGSIVGAVDAFAGFLQYTRVTASGVFSMEGSASAVDMAVDDGGEFFVSGGGLVVSTVVSDGGYLDIDNVSGGLGTIVSSGGVENIELGAVASGTVVYAGGEEDVEGGAGADLGGTTTGAILSGGTMSVLSGGLAQGASVDSGGRLVLAPGAIATADTVVAGGALELLQLYIIAGTTFVFSSAYADQTVSGVLIAGGSLIADATTVPDDATLSIASGAMTDNVLVNPGGRLTGPGELAGDKASYDSGLVSGVVLGDVDVGRGELVIASGGVASALTEAFAGDELVVASGGEAVKARVTGGQAVLTINRGGVGSDTLLAGLDDTELVLGSARATTISAGGAEFVDSGGVTALAAVRSGGVEYVLSGAATVSATVSSGGTLSLAGLGRTSQTVVLAGGLFVDDGAAVWSGASTATFAGTLTGKGKLYAAGPGTLVLSGKTSAFTGEAIIDGGAIEVAVAGALAAADIEFEAAAAKGTLQIAAADRPAAGATLAPALVDFDTTSTFIDLVGLAFVAGAKATLAGDALTLTDGAYTAAFTLSGSGASKYSVLSDGAGGTEIRAAAGSTVAPLAHAIAAFHLAAPPLAASEFASAGGTADIGLAVPRREFGPP